MELVRKMGKERAPARRLLDARATASLHATIVHEDLLALRVAHVKDLTRGPDHLSDFFLIYVRFNVMEGQNGMFVGIRMGFRRTIVTLGTRFGGNNERRQRRLLDLMFLDEGDGFLPSKNLKISRNMWVVEFLGTNRILRVLVKTALVVHHTVDGK
ncbi:hypothetical protein SMACR_09456 [Sordaria macrospora]|uniref:WGS project CABT00000000 data, contig 2.92 n=2 Tax=Sordaria macrospora TaxID=5147 RepID=F7WC23_SORMK|nr:uncharacterized protein SMAC_09456 [Sordaria macrospora k-hell]KAA8622090.1 hypothetical protein SMACR_09456 [Sordaria macrospora]KAH7631530.1 hypothetical protein B0T09DRAFT_356072 [Sordaria sp. MPI-SDFR-AT-0083]WPJ62854.1 hypothetical protein SMAC4_09456 [Sordaria macrospora]CCC05526.1 unnamed protein product [Sordaria macrospora k-hell]